MASGQVRTRALSVARTIDGKAVTTAFIGALILGAAGCNQAFSLDVTQSAQPNYYTCDCDCSRRVITPIGGTALALPAQLPVRGTLTAGSEGAILDGPADAVFNNILYTWFEVQFDNGVKGWIADVAIVPANETMVTKAAQTCLPEAINPNRGGTNPTIAQLMTLCQGPGADEAQEVVNNKLAPLGVFFCKCNAETALVTNWSSSCDADCPDGGEICLVAGSDPPDPTPTLLSEALFQPVSECQVEGMAEIVVDGHQPLQQPSLAGSVQIYGRACPAGEGCLTSLSYQVTGDDIEFDSGTVWASNPKFVGLSMTGATEKNVINMGPFLGGHIGEIPAGTALSSMRAQRSGTAEPIGLDGRNVDGIALLMGWEQRVCRLAGQAVGEAEGDEGEGTLDAQLDLLLDGTLVNQPPRPNAGQDQTVECTSAAGTEVTLDASGSSDADGNIAFYDWRVGSATGLQLAPPSVGPSVQVNQVLGQQTYHLLVVDRLFSADEDTVDVSIVDTTGATIACNAPLTITPNQVVGPMGAALAIAATADDDCTGVASLTIEDAFCTRAAKCQLGRDGGTLLIRSTGGIGNVIHWTVVARDGAGNESSTPCAITVVKPTHP